MVVDWHIRSKYAISSTTHYYQFSSRTTQLDYNSCMKSKKPLSTTAAVCLQKKNFHFGWKCISSRFRWMLKFYWNGNKCQDLTLFNQFPCQHKTYTFLAGWYSFLGLFLMFEKKGWMENIGFLSRGLRWGGGQNHYVISCLLWEKNLKIQQSFYLFCNLVM